MTAQFGGNVSFGSASSLRMEFGGLIAGTEFDQVRVTNTVLLSGILQVEFLAGFTPEQGQSFDILDWGTLNGTFNSMQLPNLNPSLAWDLTRLYHNGEIAIVPSPEPGIWHLVVLGGLIIAITIRQYR